jgi:hypothetical protein
LKGRQMGTKSGLRGKTFKWRASLFGRWGSEFAEPLSMSQLAFSVEEQNFVSSFVGWGHLSLSCQQFDAFMKSCIQVLWLMPIILATWEVEIGKIKIPSQSRHVVLETRL